MFLFLPRMCLLRKKSQNEGVRGMATLKAISIRLKSVKNIQKITQSMKMVSAAKFSRAERDLRPAKPLGEKSSFFFSEVEKTEEVPAETKRRVLYVAVTSDRGLSGAVHSSVAKVIRNDIKEPSDVKIICIGDKSRSLLQRLYSQNFLFVCQEVGRVPPTFQDASVVTNEILKTEFDYQTGKVVYNRFRSVVSYNTEEFRFYNMGILSESPSVKKFDDIDSDTLLSFFEFSLVALVYCALKEGSCSEQSSRMTAMDNASKNAGEMISKLTLTFNRTRQAVITRELIEIISGASAL